MDGQVKRRSSILKSAAGIQDLSELSVTTANMVRRRVSFHNMRTVQEFDQERNDITRSPLKEPIKLGDTGSSDGLHSTRASTFISNTDQTNAVSSDKLEYAGASLLSSEWTSDNSFGLVRKEKKKKFGGLDKTVEKFTPKSASTPMPRGCMMDCSSRLNTMFLFDPNSSFATGDERLMREKINDDTSTKKFVGSDHSSSHLDFQKYTDANVSNATRILFEPVKEGYFENTPTKVPVNVHPDNSFGVKNLSIGPEDEVTRQLFGLSMEPAAGGGTEVEVGLLEGNIDEVNTVTDKLFNITVPAASEAVEEGKKVDGEAATDAVNNEVVVVEAAETEASLIADVSVTRENPDTTQQGSSVVNEPARENTSKFRTLDSPLAVLKKKIRLESPVKPEALALSFQSNGSLEVPHLSQIQITHSSLHDLYDDFSNLASVDSAPLSPALQAIAKTKRYIRQSLDQTLNRSVPFSSPMTMLQEIMCSRHSVSSLSDEQDSLLVSGLDQSPSHFHSVLRSFANERVPEPTYIDSFQDEATEEKRTKWNDSCALTCQFDSVDFDIRIADVPCFQSKPDDHLVISRLRDVAQRNICKELTAINAESESKVEAVLKDMAKTNKRLALAIKMLNPKKLSRSEARAFEICRLKAQKTWYQLRQDVAKATVAKTSELISEKSESYERKLNDLKAVEKYKSISVHERNGTEANLLRLRNIEKLALTGFEKNKFEIASFREALHENRLENIRLKTEIANAETAVISKQIESLKEKKEAMDQLVMGIHQQYSEAKQFYLANVANFTLS